MFLFQKHFVLAWKHGTFFLAQSLSTNKSLSDNTKTRFAVSLVDYLYENVPLTEMLSCLKVAKKHVHVYCFHGKRFTCWDLRGMLETDNFVQNYSKQALPLAVFIIK